MIYWTITLADGFWKATKPAFASRTMSALESWRPNMIVRAMVTKGSPQVGYLSIINLCSHFENMLTIHTGWGICSGTAN